MLPNCCTFPIFMGCRHALYPLLLLLLGRKNVFPQGNGGTELLLHCIFCIVLVAQESCLRESSTSCLSSTSEADFFSFYFFVLFRFCFQAKFFAFAIWLGPVNVLQSSLVTISCLKTAAITVGHCCHGTERRNVPHDCACYLLKTVGSYYPKISPQLKFSD